LQCHFQELVLEDHFHTHPAHQESFWLIISVLFHSKMHNLRIWNGGKNIVNEEIFNSKWGPDEFKDSDVLYFNTLNNFKTTTDLLDNRGANYSDRTPIALLELYV
jgi:hypothetical protein